MLTIMIVVVFLLYFILRIRFNYLPESLAVIMVGMALGGIAVLTGM